MLSVSGLVNRAIRHGLGVVLTESPLPLEIFSAAKSDGKDIESTPLSVIIHFPKTDQIHRHLMVVGSLRIGEVTALRWQRIQPDRIEIAERFYEGEFDDTKTDAGRRSIPLDSHGILRAVLDAAWQRSKTGNRTISFFSQHARVAQL